MENDEYCFGNACWLAEVGCAHKHIPPSLLPLLPSILPLPSFLTFHISHPFQLILQARQFSIQVRLVDIVRHAVVAAQGIIDFVHVFHHIGQVVGQVLKEEGNGGEGGRGGKDAR